MGCDKRYGLREVWVAPEASPNTPATFAAKNYLYHCTGSTFPAVYQEALENGEATGTRGQSMPFMGAQNELSWDVTVMMPSSAEMADPTDLPESLQSLFWAAGFGYDAGPSSWQPGNASVTMGVRCSSACGRTIQLIGLDRDKRQLELLTGCVVSQVVLNFSRTDICTIQFSGIAAQKYEATAPIIAPADVGNTSFSCPCVSSYGMALPTSPAILTGVSLQVMLATSELASINGTAGQVTLKADVSGSGISAPWQGEWSVPKNASLAYNTLSPDSWTVGSGIDAVQSATITLETGQGYGELTTAAKYPTEILSGQAKVTASVTAYLVDSNMASVYRQGAAFAVHLTPNASGHYWGITEARLTEAPAIDLSSVDTPASGDFALQGGETGAYLPAFLDTLFTN